MHQSVPIFLASDDRYAPFVATTINSIAKNTKSFIDFYVLDGGILDANKQKIESLKEQFNNFSIEFIDMKNAGLERFPNMRHYSLNTFSRYFIPDLKPDLDKVLYMDVDIIVKGDIAELYNEDLGKYPLGAILEDFFPLNYTYLMETFPDYKGGNNYFNAGVLLISLDYFRKNDLTQKLIDKTVELKEVLSCPDQDIFNLFFENNFKVIDYKFNFMPDHDDCLLKLGKKEAIEALDYPVVLHYTGRKPWKDCLAKRAVDFWEIARLTPFFDELKTEYHINERLTLSKLKSKFIRYNILSKVLMGKTRDKYKHKLNDVEEKLDSIKKLSNVFTA
jgi:lipopolysaccharide biosynthesis glycosyltransferase